MMITKEAMFGNPWHGKLADGSIELVPGTPLTDITIDGVEFPVQSVTWNLGDTRYHLAPSDRVVPVTPSPIAAINGKFERDFVIYSDSMRYTPLTDDAIFPSNGFLLWDTTAVRWRKMLCSLDGTSLPGYSSRPPEGTNIATWQFTRWVPVFGEFGTQEVTPSSTAIDSGNIGYTYKWDPFFYEVVQSWEWKEDCSLSFDVSRDGKQIIVSLIGYPENSYPDPVAGTERIAAIHKFTLDGTGENILTGPTEVLPERIRPAMVWSGQHDGDPYLVEWTEGAPDGYKYYQYCQPVIGTFVGHFEESVSIRILAAHDKNGTAKVMYLRDLNNYDVDGSFSGGHKLGVGYHGLVPVSTVLPDPPAEDPYTPGNLDYDVEGSGLTDAWFGSDYAPEAMTVPYSILLSTLDVDDGYVAERALRVIDELGNVLHEWTDTEMLADYPVPIGWKRITNNVVSLEYGGKSIARVGPGAIDATVMDLPVYASFNPRTGVVVSSDEAIGFV